MPAVTKFPLRALIVFTTLPALVVGAGLWFLGSLVPECTLVEQQRLAAPDGRFDLVVFSRDCGTATEPNTQAALIPPGAELPDDAASFFAAGGVLDLAPAWAGQNALSLTVPQGADIVRQDESVAGVAVTYK